MRWRFALFLSIGFFAQAFADPQHHPPMPPMPKAFDALRPLVGKWDVTSEKDPKAPPMSATYELTSGGTALLERLFVGAPHEMISVYHMNGSKVALTHYCMLGNRPTMELKQVDGRGQTLAFELAKGGIKNVKEAHMHALTMTVVDPTHIRQEWVLYENGKPKETSTFLLTRKP